VRTVHPSLLPGAIAIRGNDLLKNYEALQETAYLCVHRECPPIARVRAELEQDRGRKGTPGDWIFSENPGSFCTGRKPTKSTNPNQQLLRKPGVKPF